MAQLDIAERTSEAEERVYLAPQWLLMWWRFRRHRVAVFSAVVLAGFYLIAVGAEFMATSEPGLPAAKRSLLPPQRVHFFEGWKPTLPYVYPPFEGKRDPVSFKMVHEVDESQKIPLRLFARGFEYKFLGLIRTDRHLIGVGGDRKAEDVISLLGADEQGRDLWSRLMIATRLSLSPRARGRGPLHDHRHRARGGVGLLRRNRRHRNPAADPRCSSRSQAFPYGSPWPLRCHRTGP